ncbi:MAG: ADP-ribosylglycohydrolase family protein [Lachnospiraceae bacterium]|nr:ADP-ribosylglycohydrolase family protein [Lachnospiraceae bacterium]
MEKTQQSRIRGGLYGLLVGDALGVPYEFHPANHIPPYCEIEMVPPKNFSRAHPLVMPGTWSDDGAQALCLLDSLAVCGRFCLKDFSDRLLCWYEEGKWAVDGDVFDVGIQTGEALNAYREGLAPEQCGILRPDGKGNGALMRTLPLALWHRGTDGELVLDAHNQCLITHGNPCNQVCCALYCLTARYLLKGQEFHPALVKAVRVLRKLYRQMPDHERELEWSVRPDEPWQGNGSGYVVDCLRSAFMILGRAKSYEEAVKQAVMLGDDTDTTACVVGGLAGIIFGEEGILGRWMEMLLGREDVEELLVRAFGRHF